MPTNPWSKLWVRPRSSAPRQGLPTTEEQESRPTWLTTLLWLTCVLLIAGTLTACAVSSTPVAASCPPFPEPPKAVQTYSASKEAPLIEEWAQHFHSFLTQLRESFNAAMRPVPSPRPAPPGR